MTSDFLVREWDASDDDALQELMRRQMSIDPGWPPEYARKDDLAAWLARPADLGRWIALDCNRVVVGHVGIGTVRPGPLSAAWQTALGCPIGNMAEICRMVVDPRVRRRGLAALLTRKAFRVCIGSGLIPVSSVLTNRGTWLHMMLATGWRNVGIVKSSGGGGEGGELVALIPPQRFIDIVMRTRSL